MTHAQTYKRLCRTCGTDITVHARYTRWKECSVCYWKRRYESNESVQDTQRRRAELGERLKVLTIELPKAKKAMEDYAAHLHAITPWFKRFWGPPSDSKLAAYRGHYYRLHSEESRVRSDLEHIPFAVERAQTVKKRYINAKLAQGAADRRQQEERQKHIALTESSVSELHGLFDRTRFHIQAKDYRRGNAVDNYCRNTFEQAILAAFGHSCAFCGCKDNLTFDHYGLTKNEGGNFVLVAADRQSLRINVVVLCRTCNSMKGQQSHREFFDEQHQGAILESQRRFLDIVLSDTRFMTLLKKWGKRREN